MSSVPESVVVGPYTYKVGIGQTYSQWGMVNHTEQKVLVDEAVTVERQRVTLMHELLHCCTELMHITDESSEEATVSALAPALVQVLRENPDLVAYLTSQ